MLVLKILLLILLVLPFILFCKTLFVPMYNKFLRDERKKELLKKREEERERDKGKEWYEKKNVRND